MIFKYVDIFGSLVYNVVPNIVGKLHITFYQLILKIWKEIYI